MSSTCPTDVASDVGRVDGGRARGASIAAPGARAPRLPVPRGGNVDALALPRANAIAAPAVSRSAASTLTKFHTPPAVRAEPEGAPANTLGIRRIMFAVDDIG
jgi:hypothetical protein